MKKLGFIVFMFCSIQQLTAASFLWGVLEFCGIVSPVPPSAAPLDQRVLIAEALQQTEIGSRNYNTWECGFYAAYHAIAKLKLTPFSYADYRAMLDRVNALDASLRSEIAAEMPAPVCPVPKFSAFPFGCSDDVFRATGLDEPHALVIKCFIALELLADNRALLKAAYQVRTLQDAVDRLLWPAVQARYKQLFVTDLSELVSIHEGVDDVVEAIDHHRENFIAVITTGSHWVTIARQKGVEKLVCFDSYQVLPPPLCVIPSVQELGNLLWHRLFLPGAQVTTDLIRVACDEIIRAQAAFFAPSNPSSKGESPDVSAASPASSGEALGRRSSRRRSRSNDFDGASAKRGRSAAATSAVAPSSGPLAITIAYAPTHEQTDGHRCGFFATAQAISLATDHEKLVSQVLEDLTRLSSTDARAALVRQKEREHRFLSDDDIKHMIGLYGLADDIEILDLGDALESQMYKHDTFLDQINHVRECVRIQTLALCILNVNGNHWVVCHVDGTSLTVYDSLLSSGDMPKILPKSLDLVIDLISRVNFISASEYRQLKRLFSRPEKIAQIRDYEGDPLDMAAIIAAEDDLYDEFSYLSQAEQKGLINYCLEPSDEEGEIVELE